MQTPSHNFVCFRTLAELALSVGENAENNLVGEHTRLTEWRAAFKASCNADDSDGWSMTSEEDDGDFMESEQVSYFRSFCVIQCDVKS